jgi:DNA-binding transcriptional regulator YhcF (GntR family)
MHRGKIASMMEWLDEVNLDVQSMVPKYLQLSREIQTAIESRGVKENQPLPSINELSFRLKVGRQTAAKTYDHLKKIGFVSSYQGKGYFVKTQYTALSPKVLVLFNKISVHKQIILEAFSKAVGTDFRINFYTYENNFETFKSILLSNPNYNHYVIIPHFKDNILEVSQLMNRISRHQLIILGKHILGLAKPCASVIENFERDIYRGLVQAQAELKKYHTIKLIFPASVPYPSEIITGLQNFCKHHKFVFNVINDLKNEQINAGEVYISLLEEDLIQLIEKVTCAGFALGTHVGIISYNESPYKRILCDGITTISTNFKEMGQKAAELLKIGSKEQVEISCSLTLRNSL